ncbi:alpha/beta fold hydrolase [Kitasatospora sp. NPDC052896]|uniref:alpha/beta fold hydrolase n=1 Tax=Kitasatospora sp. NPDC052896 TaxID=3364061 RepID=UPI0037C9D8B9
MSTGSSTDALTPRTQYLDVPGGTVAFDDTRGSGRPVVLLPGMLDSRTVYRHLRPLLTAAGHRVITMDLRGFGDSSIAWDDYSPAALATDLLALLDHLDLDRATLVGNSYTGATVVRAAATAPHRAAGIVLVDAFIEVPPPGAVQRVLTKLLGSLVLNLPSTWGTYLNHAYPTRKPADFAAYRARMVTALRTPGRRQATRGYVTGDSSPLGWTQDVRCPALVLMGTKDPDFPKPELVADRQVAALTASAPRARRVMIDGAGHYPMAEFPQATADALLPFLGEVA